MQKLLTYIPPAIFTSQKETQDRTPIAVYTIFSKFHSSVDLHQDKTYEIRKGGTIILVIKQKKERKQEILCGLQGVDL